MRGCLPDRFGLVTDSRSRSGVAFLCASVGGFGFLVFDTPRFMVLPQFAATFPGRHGLHAFFCACNGIAGLRQMTRTQEGV